MVAPINLVIVENKDRKTVAGRQYPEMGEITFDKSIDFFPGNFGLVDAFDAAAHDSARVLFAPEVGLTRIADTGSPLWHKWFFTGSSVSMGYSKAGKPVVAYAHIPTISSDSVYVRQRIADKSLKEGAAEISREEFLRILDNEGNGVIVVDYGTLKKAGSGDISLAKAGIHPQPKAFLGGDEAVVAQYLDAHKTAYKTETIGVWFRENDLPAKAENPRSRLLAFGDGYGSDLDAGYSLGDYGRVLGVPAPEALKTARSVAGAPRSMSAEAGIVRPSLEEALEVLAPYIPDACRVQARTNLAKLYK